MARYAYDVNTTQKYIDVHKQFQGGLKTVDTDDSLGAVFLRDAENVSLSEFGFIEKRYGTYEKEKQEFSGKLQGYWEFMPEETLYKIYAINGNLYVNNLAGIVDTLYLEEDTEYRYPSVSDVFGEKASQTGDFEWTVFDNPFQATRDMNAVNINKILYIFTGTYPIYAREVSGTLKFFPFSITVPTYDEIVVVGHNLLENDYEGLYSENIENFVPQSVYSAGVSTPTVTESNFLPKFPFVINDKKEKGTIDFEFKTSFPTSTQYIPWNNNTSTPYIQIVLDSAEYRNSGVGASSLDFIPLDLENVNFQGIDNYSGTSENINLFTQSVVSSEPFTKSEVESYGFSTTRIFYSFKKDIVVPRETMRNAETFTINLAKLDENNVSRGFNLSVYHDRTSEFSASYPEVISVKIIPIGLDGKEKEVVYSPAVSHSIAGETNGVYSFAKPALSYFEISSFKISFLHSASEIRDSVATPYLGPDTLFEDFADYNLTLTPLSKLQYLDRKIALTIPSLKLTVSNLISGTYDFRFNFRVDSYTYSASPSTLRFAYSTVFSTITNPVTITELPFQDYPRADDNSPGINYPKLKPIWSCNRVIEHFGKLLVWGSENMPTALFYSFPDRPTFFPSKFFLDFTNGGNNPIQSVISYMNVLIVQTEDSTWGVRGNSGLIDSPSPYIPFTVNPSVGTIAPKSVRPVRNQLFFLSKQGIVSLNSLYAVDEQYNIKFEDLNIRNIVPQDPDAVGIQFDNQYWLNFPNYGITLRWYIDKKAWVKDTYGNYQIGNDVFNRNGAWNRFNGVFKYQIENGKLAFITHPSRFDGDNLAIYKVGIDYSLPTDLGGLVTAKFETSYLNQNYPFHPKNYKETKMDFTIQNEYNLGREPIYQMETNEDIAGSTHTIDNPSLIKNHRYRLTYNFSDYELAVIDAGLFTTTVFDATIDGGSNWATATTDPIDAAFFNLVIESILLGEKIIEATTIDENTIEFLLNNDDIPQGTDLVIVGEFTDYDGGASLIDSTYDYLLDFRTWIISEEKTLNLDNLENYDQAKALIPIEIGAKFGDWVFGLSDFGNKVTAVKTIKLSGKGYNSKVYFEDYSKSKWTLESLGITYKMKRPRSR